MTTFRAGNHWGVTIVRQGERTPEGHIVGADELVAVVTNGDIELAERICALLNADQKFRAGGHLEFSVTGTPDRSYLRGASEALGFDE